MTVTAFSCDLERAGGSAGLHRIRAAFLIIFKVNAAGIPTMYLGFAPRLHGNGGVTTLKYGLLQFRLPFDEASSPAREAAARDWGRSHGTGYVHNAAGNG
jgi:hypothetical protein